MYNMQGVWGGSGITGGGRHYKGEERLYVAREGTEERDSVCLFNTKVSFPLFISSTATQTGRKCVNITHIHTDTHIHIHTYTRTHTCRDARTQLRP